MTESQNITKKGISILDYGERVVAREELGGLETTRYKLKELSPLGELKREPVDVLVHRFGREYGLKVPCPDDTYEAAERQQAGRFFQMAFEATIGTDNADYPASLIPDLLGGLVPEGNIQEILASDLQVADLAAMPGGTAASSQSHADSIIRRLTDPAWNAFQFPGVNENYGLVSGKSRGMGVQGNELWFNEGSATIYTDETERMVVLDSPLTNLRRMGLVNQERFDRVILGRTGDGRNVGVVTDRVGDELIPVLQEQDIQFAITASYAPVVDGKADSIEHMLNHSNGDPRHNFRIPYTKELGPLGLEAFVHLSRMQPEKLVEALVNKKPLELPVSARLSRVSEDAVRRAFADDLVYGSEYAAQIEISDDTIRLPYLEPAPYNYMLTGVNKNGEMVVIQIGGRKGNITGQGGVTKLELLEICNELTKKHGIEFLIDSCHGRDVDNVVTVQDGRMTDHTVLSESPYKANQDAFNRGVVTSPRYWIATE